MAEPLASGKVMLHCGDCRDVLRTLAPDSVDACVTDPPYHLVQNSRNGSSQPGDLATPYGRSGPSKVRGGFMGKSWDGGDIAFRAELWAEVLRVLKPGAHLLAFGGTRTYHRMVCAIEDAGFEVRDQIQWLYGSGFPKSRDVSKAIDAEAGAERTEITGKSLRHGGGVPGNGTSYEVSPELPTLFAPASAAAREWSGFGTALKPACEPIVLARKPLSEGTVAANVLRWGVGAINVDGCRVEAGERDARDATAKITPSLFGAMGGSKAIGTTTLGRWPANVILSDDAEVQGAFPESDSTPPGNIKPSPSTANAYGEYAERSLVGYTDSGSAARFFYTAKADSDDRLGSKHPTVKPLDLMQYLVRLVTPPRGLVLDPFAGTGTTGEAAWREGMRAILIEREAEYQDDIRRRMRLTMSGPDERGREAMKARLNGKPRDDGPLFNDQSWAEMWAKPFTGAASGPRPASVARR